MVRRGGHLGQASQRERNHQPAAVVVDGQIVEKLRPGRHSCRCQARIHDLIRNCMGCGKIVCAQEGSGPCFYCGTLVCTREEREILERGSRKSADLYKKLTGEDMPTSMGKMSLSSIGQDIEKAVDFRNRLLTADADTERRTKVNDLESDYSNIERNPYLTKEEREEIVRRREDLRRIREERKHQMVVSIDILNMTTTTTGPDLRQTDPAYDPIIRAIMERSDARKMAAAVVDSPSVVDAQWVPKGFLPKYAHTSNPLCNASDFADVNAVCMANEEVAALEVERQAHTIALPQPAATLIASGRIKCVRWHEDLHLTGPLFICASAKTATSSDIEEFNKKYVRGSFSTPLDYSPGSLMGRAYLADILTVDEFRDEISTDPVCGEGDFVLLFSAFEPLTIPVPHIPPSNFFTLEKTLRDALGHVFSSC